MAGADRYDYDGNGNVTVRHKGLSTQQTLTWSHENRLASLTATGIDESYLYDDAGMRMKKTSNGVATYYPFPHYEVSGSTATKYYFFAGQRVAMKVNGTLYYLHGDHLASTAYASTSSGSQQSGQAYYAYGRTRFVTGAPPSDHKFTGQKLDASAGLYYYNARYYDPVIGHFISPDTLVPDPTNVWDYNRFLYVRGNPLKYSDPSGYCNVMHYMGFDSVGGALDCILGSGGGGGGGGTILAAVSLAMQGAAVGAASNAAANVTAQVVKQYDTERGIVENIQMIDINPTEAGIAAGYGALSGAAVPLPGYWGIIIAGLSGGAQQVTTEMVVNDTPLSDAINVNTAIATALGVAGGIAQGSMPNTLKYPTSEGGAFNVLTGVEGAAYAPRFARITTSQLEGQQTAYISSARFVSGYFISSLPLGVDQGHQFVEPFRGPR